MSRPQKYQQSTYFFQALALVAACLAIVEIVLRIVK